MRNLSDDLAALRKRLTEAEGYLDLAGKRTLLADLEGEVARPDLWDDVDNARALTTQYGRVADDIKVLDALRSRLDDAEMLYAMAVEEDDETQGPELERELSDLDAVFRELEMRSLFRGEFDESDAIVDIHAKEGGTDAQDWVEMLLRMYLRWAEGRGFDTEIDEVSPGQEAGLLSCSFIVKGRYAYGLLAAERGVHRLVRISPFDSQARRQTSFALVNVVPFMEEVPDIEIEDKDLRVDTYRSSGAGGQHVNVTDSAVRITHMPTGIVVSCQNERSQMQNKARAMQVLAAKLAERQREERQAHLDSIAGHQAQVGWGSQIRSYVLAPYQLVKDLRTNHETGNVQAVLDGDLDDFIESWLRFRRTGDDQPE
jgi:peptide chain release factor 2